MSDREACRGAIMVKRMHSPSRIFLPVLPGSRINANHLLVGVEMML